MTYMGLSGGRAAIQHALNPPVWNGDTAVYGTQKSTTNGSVGIGITAADDVVHHLTCPQ